MQYVYLKDVKLETRAYIDMARKMGDLYEDLLKKAYSFKIATERIFDSSPVYRFIDSESIFKGFFFMFVYKDFLLREVVDLIKEMLPGNKNLRVLEQIE